MQAPERRAAARAVAREAAASGRGRQLRLRAGWTQAEAGEWCGVTGPAVCLWETGRRVPRGAGAARYGELIDRLQRLDLGQEAS